MSYTMRSYPLTEETRAKIREGCDQDALREPHPPPLTVEEHRERCRAKWAVLPVSRKRLDTEQDT